MKRNEKIVILVLVIITIIMCILLYNSRKENNVAEGQEQTGTQVENSEGIEQQESTTYNNREKVIADKDLGQFKVRNISVSAEGGLTTIRASIENTTGTSQTEFPITIELKNEQGETIQTVHAYVGNMQAGETRSIVASVNMDVTAIYDITFKR